MKCIAKYLADLERIIAFIIVGDFFQAHSYSNFIQRLTIDHLAPHFCEEALSFIGIALKQVICNYATEDGIAQVFEAFIIFISTFFYGAMAKGCIVQVHFPWCKAKDITNLSEVESFYFGDKKIS